MLRAVNQNFPKLRRLRGVMACVTLVCAVVLMTASADETDSGGALAAYVARPDPTFTWQQVAAGRIGSTDYVELLMTSQTWRSVPWKHQLFVLYPKNVDDSSHQALLFVHGGRWKQEYEAAGPRPDLPREAKIFGRLAETLRAPVGVLRQVPYQPMFDRKEDALIAYTFDRYLQTGESDWPLLLPMVKSAVRAMDVMQSVVKQQWLASIDSFAITGASKRGWTSWLVAAVDARVAAVAPMVIDVLNMRTQMDYQRATWGDLSEQIRDYSALDLPARLSSEQGRELLSIVDPYSYRARLTQPKLILLSTNDRYWPLDALKLYWSGLPDPKHVLYVPNQGHGLRDVNRIIGALSALHRYSAASKPLPRLSWSLQQASHDLVLALKSDRPTRRVLAWSAHSATKDFRDAHWRSSSCVSSGNRYTCRIVRAKQGYTALFAEAAFKDKREVLFSLSSTVCIAGPPPGPAPDC